MKYISLFLGALRKNWGKIVLFAFCVLVFALVLFPMDDLGDLVSTQAPKLTQNNLYVSFDRLGLSLLPQPGLQFRQVYVETRALPPLSVQELTVTPSISGLLYQKPFGHVSAKGFMKGQLDLHVGSGKRTEDGREKLKISVDAQKLNLLDIRDMARLPVLLNGQLSLTLKDGQLDPLFAEQPEMEVSIHIEKFELPASNLPPPLELTLPELKLGQVILNGRLSGGRLNLTSGTIGRPGDEVHGEVKMNMGLTFVNSNGAVSPVFGAYSIELDLNIQRSFKEKAGLFLSFIDAYSTPTTEGSRYRFKVSASSFQAPPSMGALR